MAMLQSHVLKEMRPIDNRILKRGEVYYVDLEDIGYGSIHISTKIRPGLIIQNDVSNTYCETYTVALLTSSPDKKVYPNDYKTTFNGKQSIVMFGQILTVDKFRIKDKLGDFTEKQMHDAEMHLIYALQLNRRFIENVVDFNFVSVETRRTANIEDTYFNLELTYEYNQKHTVPIALGKLREFSKKIYKDMSFFDLKCMFNNVMGINFLLKQV